MRAEALYESYAQVHWYDRRRAVGEERECYAYDGKHPEAHSDILRGLSYEHSRNSNTDERLIGLAGIFRYPDYPYDKSQDQSYVQKRPDEPEFFRKHRK